MTEEIFSITNKVFVITGASKGIGLSVARACSVNGANLIIISRHENELKCAVNFLDGVKHLYYELDIGDLRAVKLFYEFIKIYNLFFNSLNWKRLFKEFTSWKWCKRSS